MSRHRNVRSMNYSEEYDGYDDVYGHSVEDEYCVSPSIAAEFMYDRSKKPQMSAFFSEEDEIIEEEETDDKASPCKQRGLHTKVVLSDFDEARLQSCVEEIHNVIGDTVPENVLEDTIIRNNFDIQRSLDTILSRSGDGAEIGPKPQRERKERRREKGNKPALKPLEISTNRKDKSEVNGETTQLPESSIETSAPSVKVVPAGTKTKNVTKGFDLSADFKECLKVDTGEASPRSQSPISDRLSPTVNETAEAAWDAETTDKKTSKAKTDKSAGNEDVVVKDAGKTPSKAKESRVNAETEYQRERGQQKGLLHMVVIGHVDAGKSTLMGHLLYSLGQVNQKTMHKYEQESKKLGKQSFVYAWVLDETGEERSRGITMDVGQSRFETKTKTVILLDAPGHKDFIPNMITGASQADVAVLVVDATRGEFETGFESKGQTREHALLVRSLGVSQLAVVVNKLDMVSWSEERFNEIVSTLKTFLRQAGFRENDIVFVPCSGLTGENLTSPPKEDALKQWYKGPFLLDVIDNFKSPERPVSKPFRLPVGDVFKGTGSGFCVAGRIETGMLQVGDRVLVLPQNEAAQIKGITVDESPMQTAFAGDQIVASLSGIDMQNVCIGSIICDPSNPVSITSKIEARIVVFNIKVPITVGFPVILHYQCLAEQAVITKLLAQLHKSTGEITKTRPRCLTKNSNAVVVIEVSRPICVELYRDVKELGRFMLRVNGVTIAAGLVTKIY